MTKLDVRQQRARRRLGGARVLARKLRVTEACQEFLYSAHQTNFAEIIKRLGTLAPAKLHSHMLVLTVASGALLPPRTPAGPRWAERVIPPGRGASGPFALATERWTERYCSLSPFALAQTFPASTFSGGYAALPAEVDVTVVGGRATSTVALLRSLSAATGVTLRLLHLPGGGDLGQCRVVALGSRQALRKFVQRARVAVPANELLVAWAKS